MGRFDRGRGKTCRRRQPDDRKGHDHCSKQPAGGHPYATGDDPQKVEEEAEERHSSPAYSGGSSSSMAAFRKRAASPPVTARSTKVSDNGRRRCATSPEPQTPYLPTCMLAFRGMPGRDPGSMASGVSGAG